MISSGPLYRLILTVFYPIITILLIGSETNHNSIINLSINTYMHICPKEVFCYSCKFDSVFDTVIVHVSVLQHPNKFLNSGTIIAK